MRQSQKTETKADCQGKIGMEVQQYSGARSSAVSKNNVRRDTWRLRERILSNKNLEQARKQVRKNKGAAGIDGMTVQDLTGYLIEHGDELKAQLVAGIYRPKPVKRVEIPKPNVGMRKLGIPTVTDRTVQQMVAQFMSGVSRTAATVFVQNAVLMTPFKGVLTCTIKDTTTWLILI